MFSDLGKIYYLSGHGINITANKLDSVRFEVFTAVTIKNGVFSDVTQCGSGKNQRFRGTYCLLHQDDKNR
jgi:hypothetical protein